MKKLLGMIMILLVIVFMISCTTTEDSDKNNNEISKNDNTVVTDNMNDEASTTDIMLELTLEELAIYNGKDGAKAYVAVDGDIYDMTDSSFWKSGEHNGFEAGQDLTEAIKNSSPHGIENLKRVPKIGILVEKITELEETTDLEETSAVEEATVVEEAVVVEETTSDTTVEKPYDGVLDVKEEDIGSLRLTLEELKAYTGKDGTDAFIAVDGLIFDITYAVSWLGGEHNGFAAGEDHSENIHLSPHSYSKLDIYQLKEKQSINHQFMVNLL